MQLDFCCFLYCTFVLHFPSLRPCILSTRSIHYAYISSVLTVSFNGIRQTNKQIKQLYQFLHIQFHWFHHFNYFYWNHLFRNFHALSSTIQISTALSIPISLELPIPTVLSIPSMPFIWSFSCHHFRQFHQFLLILIPSLISLIAIIPSVANSPNKISQKKSGKTYSTGQHFLRLPVVTVASNYHLWFHVFVLFHSNSLYPF